MHPQHAAVFTLTLVSIMCSTPAKSTESTENLFPSAEPTENLFPSVETMQDAAALSAGTVQTPRVLRLLGICAGNDQEFCLRGQCRFHPDLNRPTCRCPENYRGERCEHILLNSHSDDNREKYIAISGGIAMLLCSIAAVVYCCLKKRCEREKPYQICHSPLAI